MNRRKLQPVKPCYFCVGKKEPDFMGYEILEKFISERGRILPRARTDLCTKHQRKLTREIKRARYIALLPFVVRPE